MISKKNLEKLANTPITDKFINSRQGQEAIAKGILEFYEDYYSHK